MVGCLVVLSSGGDAGLGVGLLSAGLCRLLALFSLVVTKNKRIPHKFDNISFNYKKINIYSIIIDFNFRNGYMIEVSNSKKSSKIIH